MESRRILSVVNANKYVFWCFGTGIGGLSYLLKETDFGLELRQLMDKESDEAIRFVMDKTRGGMNVFYKGSIYYFRWCSQKHEWAFISSSKVSKC